MIDYSAGAEEIDHAINAWGYTMNATDYVSSLQNQRAPSRVPGMGRGSGCVDVSKDGLERIRMAAHINRLQAHPTPMGHIATTEEILAQPVGPEITASLRAYGTYSADGRLSAKTTRRTARDTQDDVRIDGNVPVILNGDVFHSRYRMAEGNERTNESEETPLLEVPFDPSRTFAEQFTTFKEFQPEAVEQPGSNESSTSAGGNRTPSSGKRTGKGKKQKWTKVPLETVVSGPVRRGRYDTARDVGHPPVAANSQYAGRTLFDENGWKIQI